MPRIERKEKNKELKILSSYLVKNKIFTSPQGGSSKLGS